MQEGLTCTGVIVNDNPEGFKDVLLATHCIAHIADVDWEDPNTSYYEKRDKALIFSMLSINQPHLEDGYYVQLASVKDVTFIDGNTNYALLRISNAAATQPNVKSPLPVIVGNDYTDTSTSAIVASFPFGSNIPLLAINDVLPPLEIQNISTPTITLSPAGSIYAGSSGGLVYGNGKLIGIIEAYIVNKGFYPYGIANKVNLPEVQRLQSLADQYGPPPSP